jgi:hypothetical protein
MRRLVCERNQGAVFHGGLRPPPKRLSLLIRDLSLQNLLGLQRLYAFPVHSAVNQCAGCVKQEDFPIAGELAGCSSAWVGFRDRASNQTVVRTRPSQTLMIPEEVRTTIT